MTKSEYDGKIGDIYTKLETLQGQADDLRSEIKSIIRDVEMIPELADVVFDDESGDE